MTIKNIAKFSASYSNPSRTSPGVARHPNHHTISTGVPFRICCRDVVCAPRIASSNACSGMTASAVVRAVATSPNSVPARSAVTNPIHSGVDVGEAVPRISPACQNLATNR